MQALFYTGPNQMALQMTQPPGLESEEVVVGIEAVGICGSDMHAYHGPPNTHVQGGTSNHSAWELDGLRSLLVERCDAPGTKSTLCSQLCSQLPRTCFFHAARAAPGKCVLPPTSNRNTKLRQCALAFVGWQAGTL